MFDDFFIRALIAGIGIALVTGPLGCFIIWRRLSFFGDTLSHSALLGVTIAFFFELNIAFSVFLISSAIALILLKLQKTTKLPGDALLGLLAHSSLAVGLVVIGFLTTIRFDIMGLLFGDILAVNEIDLLIIWIGGALILLILKYIWKPLFASTVNHELAEAEGMNPDKVNAIFTVLLAAIIAISIKIVGLLLITGMLIMPAAMARNVSNNPTQMVKLSIIGGLLSVIIGLFSSLEINTPSGPSIITAALVLFCLTLINIKNYSELTKKSYCDAGCGVGSLSIPLLRLGIKELQVSDISSEMIKETKKRINELGLNQGKIKYEVCDLEKLKGLFDVVVCLDVFIHYPQPVAEEMVQHLCDLSKEKLIVSFAPYTPVLAVLKNIGKLFPGPSKTTRAYTLKEKGIINAAKERGFKVVKKKLNQAPFYFSKLIEFEKIK